MTTISSIEGMLQQLRGLAQSATGTESQATSAAAAGPGSFAGELQRSLARVSAVQDHAYGQADAFELGKPGVSLNDVMIDMQKANVSFQTAVQVRNKLAGAYQEIMSMTV